MKLPKICELLPLLHFPVAANPKFHKYDGTYCARCGKKLLEHGDQALARKQWFAVRRETAEWNQLQTAVDAGKLGTQLGKVLSYEKKMVAYRGILDKYRREERRHLEEKENAKIREG
jgi:hypothetical protein